MDLLVGLLTIILITYILKCMCINREYIACLTILIVLFALPIISEIGNYVLDLFQ